MSFAPQYIGRFNRLSSELVEKIYFSLDSDSKQNFRNAHPYPIIGVKYISPDRLIISPDSVCTGEFDDEWEKYEDGGWYEQDRIEAEWGQDDEGVEDWWYKQEDYY